MFPGSRWLVLGLTGYLGKKIYDAVTDRSSSVTTVYWDNSEELEQEAREAERQKAEAQRRDRQRKQLMQAIKGELRTLCHRFGIEQAVPSSINDTQLRYFLNFKITDISSASAALGKLLGKTAKLKEQPGQQAEYERQLAALDELEQFVEKL